MTSKQEWRIRVKIAEAIEEWAKEWGYEISMFQESSIIMKISGKLDSEFKEE